MTFDAPIHTNEANLSRVLAAGLPVLLVFWRRDCAPCDQLAPTLDRLAWSYAGRALVVKVDAAEERGLVRRYTIDRLPSLLFFQEGQLLATAVGVAGERELVAWLDHLAGNAARPPVPGGPSIALGSPSGGQTARPTDAAARPTEPAQGAARTPTGQPVILTDDTFDAMIRQTALPVLVDFWAAWCGPCKMIAPAVADLAHEFADRVVVGKLNVDENPGIARRYNIMSIPTLLIFRNGQMVDQIVGAQPAQVLRQRLARQVA